MDGPYAVADSTREEVERHRLSRQDAASGGFAHHDAAALDIGPRARERQVRPHELFVQYHVPVDHEDIVAARHGEGSIANRGEPEAPILLPDMAERNDELLGPLQHE